MSFQDPRACAPAAASAGDIDAFDLAYTVSYAAEPAHSDRYLPIEDDINDAIATRQEDGLSPPQGGSAGP